MTLLCCLGVQKYRLFWRREDAEPLRAGDDSVREGETVGGEGRQVHLQVRGRTAGGGRRPQSGARQHGHLLRQGDGTNCLVLINLNNKSMYLLVIKFNKDKIPTTAFISSQWHQAFQSYKLCRFCLGYTYLLASVPISCISALCWRKRGDSISTNTRSPNYIIYIISSHFFPKNIARNSNSKTHPWDL